MLKLMLSAAMILAPFSAMAGQRYCQEKENTDYETWLERIPYGIAIVDEEWPNYCHLQPHGKEANAFICENLKDAQVIVNIDLDDPRKPVTVNNDVFVPCS